MKKLTLLVLAVVTAGTTFTACKKTEKIDEKIDEQFYYEYDNKKTEISYVELNKLTEYGLIFVLSNETVTKENDKITNKEYLSIEIPNELLDKKVDLNADNEISWYPMGTIASEKNDINFQWTDRSTNDLPNKLTGDNNWMKATKNSDNNYTIELDIYIENKHIKGYYKGDISKTVIVTED